MIKDELRTKLIIEGTIKKDTIVSFLIPTYNRLNTLKTTIKSIVANNKFNYEIIITDNTDIYSIENTVNYIKSLNDDHIFYFNNEKDYGMVNNWNVGLFHARGKYVVYIHDDDVIDKKYFDVIYELLFNKLKNKRIGFIKAKFDNFSDESNINSNLNLTYGYNKIFKVESLLYGVGPTYTPSCGLLFNKEILLKMGGFNPEYYPCADHIIGFDILNAGYEGYITKDIIGHYRWGINESLKKETLINTVDKNFIIREHFYSNNILYKIYGFVFKKLYYTRDVYNYLYNAKLFNQKVSIEEIVKRKEYYIKNNIVYKLLDMINRILVKIVKILINIIN